MVEGSRPIKASTALARAAALSEFGMGRAGTPDAGGTGAAGSATRALVRAWLPRVLLRRGEPSIRGFARKRSGHGHYVPERR